MMFCEAPAQEDKYFIFFNLLGKKKKTKLGLPALFHNVTLCLCFHIGYISYRL